MEGRAHGNPFGGCKMGCVRMVVVVVVVVVVEEREIYISAAGRFPSHLGG